MAAMHAVPKLYTYVAVGWLHLCTLGGGAGYMCAMYAMYPPILTRACTGYIILLHHGVYYTTNFQHEEVTWSTPHLNRTQTPHNLTKLLLRMSTCTLQTILFAAVVQEVRKPHKYCIQTNLLYLHTSYVPIFLVYHF